MNELATEKERVEFCWTMSIALDGRLRYFHAAMVDLASIIVVIQRMRLLYVTRYILQRFFPTILNLLFFKDRFCIFFYLYPNIVQINMRQMGNFSHLSSNSQNQIRFMVIYKISGQCCRKDAVSKDSTKFLQIFLC